MDTTLLVVGDVDPRFAPRVRALLALTKSNRLHVTNRIDWGGYSTPVDEVYGATRVWELLRGPAELDVAALRSDLKPGGILYDPIRRVAAGRSIQWDGTHEVGTLSADADAASDDVACRLAETHADGTSRYLRGLVLTPTEWLAARGESDGMTPHTSDEELAEVARRMQAQARQHRVRLIDPRLELQRRRAARTAGDVAARVGESGI